MARLFPGVIPSNHTARSLKQKNMSQYPNNELDALYDQTDSAEAPGGYNPKLEIGTHIVLVDTYRGQRSQNKQSNVGTFLSLELVVEQSSIHQPGSRRGWAFFPQKPGYGAVYEQDRLKQFLTSVDQSLKMLPRPTKETGGDLASGALRGLRLHVTVEQACDKKTGAQLRDKNGKPILNAMWAPIEQTRDAVAAQNAKMPPPIVRAERPAQGGGGYTQQFAGQAPVAAPNYPQAPAPQYAQAPAPQQYAQAPAAPAAYPQGYPQQGYPQAPPQQFAPQGYPPGVAAPGQQPPAGSFLAGLRGNGG